MISIAGHFFLCYQLVYVIWVTWLTYYHWSPSVVMQMCECASCLNLDISNFLIWTLWPISIKFTIKYLWLYKISHVNLFPREDKIGWCYMKSSLDLLSWKKWNLNENILSYSLDSRLSNRGLYGYYSLKGVRWLHWY